MNEGGAIIIYPEGTLTRDPALWPMKGHTGAARMALESGIPVVPMAHWGAQEVFPRYAKRFYVFPRKTSRLVVGEPVDLSAFAGRPLDKATLTAATNVIMDAITALLAELRGEQPPAAALGPGRAQPPVSTHGRFVERGSRAETGCGTDTAQAHRAEHRQEHGHNCRHKRRHGTDPDGIA